MAGYGHTSLTGIDERTLGRIDLLLYDADYANSSAAVDDAWRTAVLAADPRVRDAHERARADAVQAANRRRDPAAAPVRTASTVHRVALTLAVLCAAAAAALIVTSPSRTSALPQTMLPAGLCAAAAVSLLWWLEPLRANGSLWGSRLPSALHLLCAVLWAFAASTALLGRWSEIGERPLPVTTGLTLLVVSIAAILLLWRRARAADRAPRRSGIARVTGELIDARDAADVFEVLDLWWALAGPDAMERDGARVRRVRIEVLGRLEAARIVTAHHVRFAAAETEPPPWRERRR